MLIALGGTAFAATATVVNIADPTAPANIAQVNKSGPLQTLGVDERHQHRQQRARPAPRRLHFSRLGVTTSSGCVEVAAPPSSDQALVVRDVMIDVIQDRSPGVGENVCIFRAPTAALRQSEM